MINFKKGPALSLHQVNYIGSAKTNEGVVAGMVVQLNGSGEVVKAGITNSADDKDGIFGFAINNQTAGDVIESGKIGVYALDGASVVETDQADTTINATNYPVGTLLSATAGKVVAVANTFAGKIIGQVEGIRVIPRGSEPSVTVLGVKLFS
jgi:hypothetical protein